MEDEIARGLMRGRQMKNNQVHFIYSMLNQSNGFK
jgi:hypothetical protein